MIGAMSTNPTRIDDPGGVSKLFWACHCSPDICWHPCLSSWGWTLACAAPRWSGGKQKVQYTPHTDQQGTDEAPPWAIQTSRQSCSTERRRWQGESSSSRQPQHLPPVISSVISYMISFHMISCMISSSYTIWYHVWYHHHIRSYHGYHYYHMFDIIYDIIYDNWPSQCIDLWYSRPVPRTLHEARHDYDMMANLNCAHCRIIIAVITGFELMASLRKASQVTDNHKILDLMS